MFGEHWRVGELAILFGETGSGKSLLAAQIVHAVSSGWQPTQPWPFELDVSPQRVVYFDLELSDEQFDKRYTSAPGDPPAEFPFNPRFIRVPPRSEDYEIPPGFRDYTEWLIHSMVEFIEVSDARVVIIDNITWLNNATQIGNSATRVMKMLNRLKKSMDLSILVIAHTPKRPIHTRLTLNDLQGSIMLANLTDSLFALGTSTKGRDIRYVKSIKRRSFAGGSIDEVSVIRLVKDQCFLGFEYLGEEDETEHAPKISRERLIKIEKMLSLADRGLTQKRIGEMTGVSSATVNRCLKRRNDDVSNET